MHTIKHASTSNLTPFLFSFYVVFLHLNQVPRRLVISVATREFVTATSLIWAKSPDAMCEFPTPTPDKRFLYRPSASWQAALTMHKPFLPRSSAEFWPFTGEIRQHRKHCAYGHFFQRTLQLFVDDYRKLFIPKHNGQPVQMYAVYVNMGWIDRPIMWKRPILGSMSSNAVYSSI